MVHRPQTALRIVWVQPLLTLLDEVARGLAPAYRPFELGEPGVLRIHRDLRFSRDKTQ